MGNLFRWALIAFLVGHLAVKEMTGHNLPLWAGLSIPLALLAAWQWFDLKPPKGGEGE